MKTLTFILVLSERKQTRQGGKLEFNWDDPYEIAEQYKLKSNSGKILKQGIRSINLKICKNTDMVS